MLTRLFARRRSLALGLLLGLTLKLLVPTGYMLDFSRSPAQGLFVVFCGGLQLPAEAHDHQHHDSGNHAAAGAQAEVCPYFVAGGLPLASSSFVGSWDGSRARLQGLEQRQWLPLQVLDYSMVPRAPPVLLKT